MILLCNTDFFYGWSIRNVTQVWAFIKTILFIRFDFLIWNTKENVIKRKKKEILFLIDWKARKAFKMIFKEWKK